MQSANSCPSATMATFLSLTKPILAGWPKEMEARYQAGGRHNDHQLYCPPGMPYHPVTFNSEAESVQNNIKEFP